jgi:hypothetical protein
MKILKRKLYVEVLKHTNKPIRERLKFCVEIFFGDGSELFWTLNLRQKLRAIYQTAKRKEKFIEI